MLDTWKIRASVVLQMRGEALLELKTAFNATPGALSSWRPADGDPCGWEGISCSFPYLRVQSITLSRQHLKQAIASDFSPQELAAARLGSISRALHQNSLHGPIPLEINNCTQLRAMYATLSSSNSLQTNHRLTEDLGYTITLPAGTTLEMD